MALPQMYRGGLIRAKCHHGHFLAPPSDQLTVSGARPFGHSLVKLPLRMPEFWRSHPRSKKPDEQSAWHCFAGPAPVVSKFGIHKALNNNDYFPNDQEIVSFKTFRFNNAATLSWFASDVSKHDLPVIPSDTADR